MDKTDLKIKILKKQNSIIELIGDMISDALEDKPDKNRLPKNYYINVIETEARLLARILEERE